MQRHLNIKRPESVLVVVHTATSALLIKRTDHKNFWQSVTGSMEWGEAAYAAAVRELKEETGLQVNNIKTTGISRSFQIIPEWQYRFEQGVTRNREYLFYCLLDQECTISLDPNEHTDYQWLPIAEAKQQVWSWTNKLALMMLS